jgi:hypothetical protein
LVRYVRAFEDHDIPALLALIRDDAVMTMPPDSAWFEGRAAEITGFVNPSLLAFFDVPEELPPESSRRQSF